MPPPGTVLRAVERLAIRWSVMAFLALSPRLAPGDHGAPVLPPKTGVDWTTWLLIAGAVAAVGLAAWAFLAPDRGEPRGGPESSQEAEPRSRIR